MRWLTPLCLALASCLPSAAPVAQQPSAPLDAPSAAASTGSWGEGVASWYGPGFAGRRTASGEVFDPSQLTAAHKTLPFGTTLRVTNLANGLSVTVRINDRGPFIPGRVIDLSRAAAERIGMIGSGTARVRLEPLAASGGALLAALGRTLEDYAVVSARYEVGTLLLLGAPDSDARLVVRVVSGDR